MLGMNGRERKLMCGYLQVVVFGNCFLLMSLAFEVIAVVKKAEGLIILDWGQTEGVEVLWMTTTPGKYHSDAKQPHMQPNMQYPLTVYLET